jgi:riboflavin kinase/FMN adenylyltransferase
MRSDVQVIRNRPGKSHLGRGGRSVVTIGNFDGIHLGHQALIRRSRELAAGQASLAVVTFEPLPQALFQPNAAPPRLSTVYQKLAQFRAEGVDTVWLMRFDLALSRLSARAFATQVLALGLGAMQVVVGADFRFGYRREGDVERLRSLGEELGFGVEIVPAVFLGENRISSSAIRRVLQAGAFADANAMLGRPFRMEGHVVPGRHLGRKLGYPTANLRIRTPPSVVQGIFAVFARAPGCPEDRHGAWMPAVSSIGMRPTIGGTEPLLEVHFFDFDGDLYGQRLEVEFVAKLRDESHFESLEQLVAQMRRDEAQARAILALAEQPV